MFFLTFALLLLLCFVYFCLRSKGRSTLKEALDIFTHCLKSLCQCTWPTGHETRDRREINHITIATIGEINQGFYGVNFAPPSYESVIAADKSRDQDLPSYEDALKFICIDVYHLSDSGNGSNSSESWILYLNYAELIYYGGLVFNSSKKVPNFMGPIELFTLVLFCIFVLLLFSFCVCVSLHWCFIQ